MWRNYFQTVLHFLMVFHHELILDGFRDNRRFWMKEDAFLEATDFSSVTFWLLLHEF